MTKTKKIAVAAVAVVMAGALAVSFTACGKKEKNSEDTLKLVNMSYTSGTELNAAIGYSSSDTGMFYGSAVGTGRTFVGNYAASSGVAKPATKAIQDALDIKFVDKYGGYGTSTNLSEMVNQNLWGSSVDLATSDLSVAVTEAAQGNVLNLADYLDYMPNFKAFLEDNPIVYLSILQAGMDTTDGSGQQLYVAPYFDGMDDIEKGVLMRQDWIEDVLDYSTWSGNTTATKTAADDTFKTACYSTGHGSANTQASGTYAASYMGTTGSWSIVSTAEPSDGEEANGSETVTITKNYDSAIDELENTSSSLYTAWASIAGSGVTYSGKSGNIVDIMNEALNSTASGAKGLDATGENMANLYREYIAVAYTVDGEKYYGTDSNPYSKVFNGYSACWDVDDLTVLLRIIKCSSGQVGLAAREKTTGIFPRDYSNSRTPDIISLVGELYGCRGATSRYENTYIDGNGNLQDARDDVRFWEALNDFGGLAKEGLLDGGYDNNGAQVGTPNQYLDTMHGTSTSNGVGFMQWDYSQTQTTQLFDGILDDDANYGWVNTPVSLWDDGTKNESGYSYSNSNGYKYMRFTDSWRSTKTAGLVVAKSVENDPNKLAAALSFVDFLYSNDGQITTTYAIQDTSTSHSNETGDPTTGTWYGDKVEDLSSIAGDASEYTDLCDETSMWVVKPAYADSYVVKGNYIYDVNTKELATEKIYDSEGNLIEEKDISTDLETYANKTSWYSVKSEYESQCFTYGGTIYTGTLYKGKMTPTITDELYEHFISASSPEAAVTGYSGVKGNFTNFARYILGSTLPICVKDQSFENQMTAKIASADATKVSVSIGNGTINHCDLTVREDNYFYTCVPTGFPLDNFDTQALSGTNQDTIRYLTGTGYGGNTAFYSLYHHIIWYGFSGTYSQNNVKLNLNNYPSAEELVSYLQGVGLKGRLDILKDGWETAKAYWAYLGK